MAAGDQISLYTCFFCLISHTFSASFSSFSPIHRPQLLFVCLCDEFIFFGKTWKTSGVFTAPPATHWGCPRSALGSSKYNLIIVPEVRGHSWVPWGLFISRNGGKRLQVSETDLSIYCAWIPEVLHHSWDFISLRFIFHIKIFVHRNDFKFLFERSIYWSALFSKYKHFYSVNHS